jgi:hypothetical protein
MGTGSPTGDWVKLVLVTKAVLPRLAVLATATTIVLVVSLAVTALSFTPRSWPAFTAGNLIVGLTYACVGALAGAALGQLGATYVVLFLAMLGIGILQNPMFGDGTPGGLASAFPDYGAGRVIIDGHSQTASTRGASSCSPPAG